MKLFFLLALVLVLLHPACSSSFIPALDLMTYNSDGELVVVWGEHNFYTDTSLFGKVLSYYNETYFIGGKHG